MPWNCQGMRCIGIASISVSALKADVTMNQIGKANSTAITNAMRVRTGRPRQLFIRRLRMTVEPQLDQGNGHDESTHQHRKRGRVAHAEVLDAVTKIETAQYLLR